MVLGKEVRLNRLTNLKSKRFVGITIDHAMARGVISGLVNVKETLSKICEGKPDAITMHKGIAENLYGLYAGRTPFILKGTTFSPYHKNYDTPTADVEEAVRLGADAISVGVIVGGPEQAEQISYLAKISKNALNYGMPLVAHIYPRGSEVKNHDDPDAIAYAVRVGAELGVDIIKTNWSGCPLTFEKVIQACPAKVVIAGGSPGNDLESYLRMTWDGVQVGIFGVAYGRFVWQDSNPVAVIAAVKAMVHDSFTVREAMDLYRNCK